METKTRLFSLILVFLFAIPLFAEESFSQKIEWKSNANALEYKVEIQNVATGKTQTITTDKTSAELSLPPASYRYRVRAYDFLGKESSVSAWTSFEVFKANKPKILNVEKSLTVPKNGGTVALNVEISDINKNSKFELVNESLQGIISAEEKSKMSASSSETESIKHLDFKNVPPGKWRLRVTNASGLSELSEPITVEGENMYSADELNKIRAEAEEKVRKELQETFEAEVQKRIAAHDLEKERAEAERIAAEKKAEEDRLREEEERLAEEERLEAERLAAEEEERRRERERNRRGYHWKDVIFEGGVGITKLLYDKEFKNSYDEKLALALNVRAMFLPVKKRHNKFGLEVCYLGQNLAKSNEYFDAKLTANVATAKIVWHHELFSSVYLSVKGGGGGCLFQKSIEYASDYSSRQASSGKTYFYPAACGNLSIFCNALKFVVFEVGAEYTHVLVNSSSFGIVTPYACAGLRF